MLFYISNNPFFTPWENGVFFKNYRKEILKKLYLFTQSPHLLISFELSCLTFFTIHPPPTTIIFPHPFLLIIFKLKFFLMHITYFLNIFRVYNTSSRIAIILKTFPFLLNAYLTIIAWIITIIPHLIHNKSEIHN